MTRRNPQSAIRILAALLVLCSASVVWAHSEESAVSLRNYSSIEVDGTLKDWVRRLESSNWLGRLEVEKGQVFQSIRAAPIYINTTTSKVEAGSVRDADDLSATVYTLWDDQRFYVAAVVTDDEVVVQHEGENIWQDDAVEFWMDCRHDAVTRSLFQDDEYQFGFSPAAQDRAHAVSWAWRNARATEVTDALEGGSSLIKGGYIIEGSVPWAVLQSCKPSFGGAIGFNISIVDKDADQQWTHVTWSGSLHSDPSQFGHLFFVDAPIDLFPSDVFESAPSHTPWEEPQ